MLTDDFSPLADALGWQLAGDAIKICSWVAGITLISHARIGIFMITEVIFSCLLVVFSILGGYYDGLTGTAIGYAASYLLHFVTMTCLLFLLAPAKKTENKL
jgi:PST family polysaccharide transporter